MNKEFFESQKAKWELIRIKYEALNIRDTYIINHLKNIIWLLTILTLMSC
jgi:hypothetical protein